MWILDNYGTKLIALIYNGQCFEWDAAAGNATSTRATLLANAPTASRHVLVSTPLYSSAASDVYKRQSVPILISPEDGNAAVVANTISVVVKSVMAVANVVVAAPKAVPPYRPLPQTHPCLLYTSPSPRDGLLSRMPSSA